MKIETGAPRIRVSSFLTLAIMCLVSIAHAEPAPTHTSITLDSGWEFRQLMEGPAAQESVWRKAQVPGTVHTDLLANQVIPNPYYRDNEEKLQWIENADWEYRNTLQIDKQILSHRNVELVFGGLDTCADVYINDTLVLTANNMFLEWRVDAKPHLKPGANQLRVVFHSVIKQASKLAAADPWRNKINVPDKSYIRKAAFMYGWDWGPRFVTAGIWKPVSLEAWDDARISDFHIRQRDVTTDVAHLSAEVEIISAVSAEAKVEVSYERNGKARKVSASVPVHVGVNQMALPISIGKPELWYPTGYGPQALYNFQGRVSVGKSADETTVRTGLRSVVLRREKDQWGRSFEVVVNGIPIFAKGADVIPFDSFPTRVTVSQYRNVLQSARDANMNMIRHWGGGYYESHEFYDICDELGLLVWQDFMFAYDPLPSTYEFKQEVAREAEFQLRRLRNHPSIVLWCGNNEAETAWRGWRGDFFKSAGPEVRDRIWQDYTVIFSGVLARAVERLSPETPYWPSSPSSDYEDTSDSADSGDVHNWSIWHGLLPLKDYEKTFPRFLSEYGMQSFPEMRTIESFSLPEDRTGITSHVLLAHQKNARGNEIIREYMLRDYPEPRDFTSFVYLSQVLQAEAVKTAAEHLRRNRPRTMGTLYWQLNDCWPVASWSSLDYYGRWKALHWHAKRFYNELLVSPHEENGGVAVYVISDRTVPTDGELRVRLMNANGELLITKTQAITIAPLSSQLTMNLPMAEFANLKGYDPATSFLVADLLVDGKTASRNLLYFTAPKDMPIGAPRFTTEITSRGRIYVLRLSTNRLAREVGISFGALNARLSDNYFDAVPGDISEIEIDSDATLEQLQSAMKIVSLGDVLTIQTDTGAAK